MKSVTPIVSLLAMTALAATTAYGIGNPGQVCFEGGSSTSPTATTNGAIWLDTGSGPQLIPDSNGDNRNSDINFEWLGGTSPGNLQLLDAPGGAVDFNGTPFTSLLLLSTPFEMLADGEIDANCAAYDMNFGGPPGMIMDQTYFTYLVPGSTGAAYFRLLAWTGLYNTFDAAAAAGADVADTGVFPGVTCAGGIMPVPSLNASMPAMILRQYLPGDANLDGKVDINDLTIVLSNYGQSTGANGWGLGDFTGDGTVDINDLTIVLAHYGQSVGSSAGPVAAVPEPGALVLLTAGLASLLACAWKEHK